MVTGMRQGELLGFKWQAITFSTGSLQVRRILSRVMSEGSVREFVEADPKTEQSRRSIPLAPFALSALKQHRVCQLEAKVKVSPAWQEHDDVFCTLTGTHLGQNYVVDGFKKILKGAGLPAILFRDLHHSTAMLLLDVGVHAKVVQEMHGHTQISMTMHLYSHVLPSMQLSAVRRLHDLLQEDMSSDDVNLSGEQTVLQ